MCTRFHVDQKLQHYFNLPASVSNKDIHPNDPCFVITSNQKKIVNFGYKYNSLILNARQETIYEKPLFKHAIIEDRCIVPASSFYEWNKDKQMIEFYCDHIIYFTGILIKDHLVIITTSANKDMIDTHDRMPVILNKADIKPFLSNDDVRSIINKNDIHLRQNSSYIQPTLF